MYLALFEAIAIQQGDSKEKGTESIPGILSDALAVSFDDHIGHNYLEDYEDRYAFTTSKKNVFPLT